jgi:hypothetical protein
MLRAYQEGDYEQLKSLYAHSEWYGGTFDEARDGRERLARKITADPWSIWVYVQDGKVVGSVSLIDDGRIAWLYRLVVQDNDAVVTRDLYEHALKTLKKRGHEQVLVYTPAGDQTLYYRYEQLGMTRGADYTCYWASVS